MPSLSLKCFETILL